MTVKLLDHGYIELVESWGSDQSIIEAARMSTGKGFLGWGPRHTAKCAEQRAETFRNYRGPPQEGIFKCTCGGNNPGDEKLLRYLWEHGHATPFEMAGLTFEVKAPIMVFREWHRHRVPFGYNEMCLAPDTEITCIGSGGLVRRYTIEHIYRMKHEGVVDRHPARDPLPVGVTRNGYSRVGRPVMRKRRSHGQAEHWRVRKLPSCQQRTLRVLNEETELYETAAMLDVWQSGVQEVWVVETEKGHAVKSSANHPFYTLEGWKKLSELRAGDRLATNGLVAAMERPYPPALRSGIGVWTSMMRSRLIADKDHCYVCGGLFEFNELELDHVVPVTSDLRRALDEDNLRPICWKCHKVKSADEQQHREGQTRLGLRWVDLKKRPVRVGEEMTYDIEVEGKHKNFVANGLVVHNSARYVPLPDENYLPDGRAHCLGLARDQEQAGGVSRRCM